METTSHAPKSSPRARQNAKTQSRKSADREKCTLLLDSDTSMKLSVAAHIRKLDRSELVNQLLADALRYVVISLRGQNPVSATLDASVESPAEIAA